jgi:hypothetical protein
MTSQGTQVMLVCCFCPWSAKAGAGTAALRGVLAQHGHDKPRENHSGVWLHKGSMGCWQGLVMQVSVAGRNTGSVGKWGWCDRVRQGEAGVGGGGGDKGVGSVATAQRSNLGAVASCHGCNASTFLRTHLAMLSACSGCTYVFAAQARATF